MARCQCIKNNGQQCIRDASTKIGHNPLCWWQHQNCCSSILSKKIPIDRKKNKKQIQQKVGEKNKKLSK